MTSTSTDMTSSSTRLSSNDGSLATLRRFTYTTLLNEDTQTRTITLLGTYTRSPTEDGNSDDVPALLKMERQNFSHESLDTFVKSLDKAESLITNDVYHLFLAWSGKGDNVPADLKITLIQPATEVEIRKASKQTYKMVRETPKLYQSVVLPYLQSFPPGRLSWVYNILEHRKESENIVYEDSDQSTGFIILPDLKWDQLNMSMLYLQCIVHNRNIKCLRDLTPNHLPMLKNIRKNAEAAAMKKYGVAKGDLRMFVHYQPSFYHFHVHIVHVSCHGYAGSTIGQAHLLDSIIDNLELEEADGLPAGRPSYYARRTLTYGLGEQHGLYKQLWQATEATQS